MVVADRTVRTDVGTGGNLELRLGKNEGEFRGKQSSPKLAETRSEKLILLRFDTKQPDISRGRPIEVYRISKEENR